jgi:hypothetical protein
MIVHQRRQTRWWWLLLIAFVFLPWGLSGHWLVPGTAWLAIAALLAWRLKRRVRGQPPSLEQLHS